MKRRHIWRTIYPFAFVSILFIGAVSSTAWGGSLRIFMTDGTSVEVPYYWKQNAEYKFYTSGGVAGIPENQVASVQEILTAKVLDPATLSDASKDTSGASPSTNRREELLAAQMPPIPNQGTAPAPVSAVKEPKKPAESNISRPLFNLEGDFSRVIGSEGSGQTIILRNVLSSQTKLNPDRLKFRVILYDGDGNKLETKDCEWQKLNLSKDTLRELNSRDNLYLVVATIKHDPRIKSYEITAVKP